MLTQESNKFEVHLEIMTEKKFTLPSLRNQDWKKS